jgi:GntR family transcriptional regulator
MRKRILFKEEEISREIERQIQEERLKEGDRLPSERQLAESFGVQRDTVRCALEVLLKKGELVKVPRQGYYVAPRKIVLNIRDFSSVRKDVAGIGKKYKATVLGFERVSLDSEHSEVAGLPEGTICYQVLRLRSDDDKPISVEKSYLPADHAPGLTKADVISKPSSSILKQKYGINLGSAQQKITQVYAAELEAALLKISKNEPLIRYEGIVYDKRGRVVEFFDNFIKIDCVEFRIRDFA